LGGFGKPFDFWSVYTAEMPIREENYIEDNLADAVFPVPTNELDRALALHELDFDYSELDQSLDDLTRLAAKIAETNISVVNLIDTFTQWSISSFGLQIKQTPREETICQYAILGDHDRGMEVEDLSKDERFRDMAFVTGSPDLRYYFGIPLKINEGLPIGTLCVLHDKHKNLSQEKKEMLEILAKEIVDRIRLGNAVKVLSRQLQDANHIKNNIAHDVRGPISGIIGLAEIIQVQGVDTDVEETKNYLGLIQKSGQSVLELTDEILSACKDATKPQGNQFTLNTLRTKLANIFGPQAVTKDVKLDIQVSPVYANLPFAKNSILQILGNLISNSIKFTPKGGEVVVDLDMKVTERNHLLLVKVKDSGVGMSSEKIDEIFRQQMSTSAGTAGETGYGLGLQLVNRLVSKLKGKISVKSEQGQGVEFELILPVS
jgi:signal transduction histidine kinase